MKKRNLFVHIMLVVFTLISINALAENEGPVDSNYKISPDLNFNTTSGYQKCWEIAYGEAKNPVHVFMKETKKGQEYLVRSSYFEVKYVNGTQGFGARLVTGKESTVSEPLNEAVLNQIQLGRQNNINSKSIGDDQILGMIASYLPDLINVQYNSILN
jgi:hypothetical protein